MHVEAEEVRPQERHGLDLAGAQDRPVVEVLARRDPEREGAHREEQPAHAKGADADERGESRGDQRGNQDRRPEAEAFDSAADQARVMPADVDGDAAVERGGEERADSGERHLPERELTGPAGEDRERQAAQGEHEDGRVEQVPRRLRDDQRQHDRAGHQREQRTAVEVAHPPDAAEPFRDRPPLRRERERLGLLDAPAALEVHRDEHRR